MLSSWQEALEKLRNFIANNPDIKISRKFTAIPNNKRPEFYRLFDIVRIGYLKDKFPELLDESNALSKSYAQGEGEVIKLLGLTDVLLPTQLGWYLRNPVNGLARILFNPLFDLIKDKIDNENFDLIASREIDNAYRNLYHLGYERWLILSLIKLLVANKMFEVNTEKLDANVPSVSPDIGIVAHEDIVPNEEETKHLSLDHGGKEKITFVVPDFIINSARIHQCVAIKTRMVDPIWTAKVISEKRQWLDIKSVKEKFGSRISWPDLLIYIDDNARELVLIADEKRVSQPDLIVECTVQKDWYQQEGLDMLKIYREALKPKYGTYIVSRWPVPEQVFREFIKKSFPKESTLEIDEKREIDIHILNVGFNQSMLEPIINTLKPLDNEVL